MISVLMALSAFSAFIMVVLGIVAAKRAFSRGLEFLGLFASAYAVVMTILVCILFFLAWVFWR